MLDVQRSELEKRIDLDATKTMVSIKTSIGPPKYVIANNSEIFKLTCFWDSMPVFIHTIVLVASRSTFWSNSELWKLNTV